MTRPFVIIDETSNKLLTSAGGEPSLTLDNTQALYYRTEEHAQELLDYYSKRFGNADDVRLKVKHVNDVDSLYPRDWRLFV